VNSLNFIGRVKKEKKLQTRIYVISKNYLCILSRQKLYSFFKFGIITIFIYCLFSNLTAAQLKTESGFYDDLFSVTFPTEKKGWVCGRWGNILHTTDGGKTWIRQNSNIDFTLSSIFFVDEKNGWAVGDQGTIIHTRDGGKTWDIQKSPVSFFLMDVYFVTPLKGWIVTERTHILYTDDGGKIWRVQWKDKDFILQAVSFCDKIHGWAVGEYGYIYHTRDGGANWKKQAGHYEISREKEVIVGDPSLFDVVAIDPQTAWAVGIDSHVIKTLDGGKKWQKVETGAAKTQLFSVITDKKDSILVGGNGVFLSSTDKGRTWQSPKFDPPIIYGWIYGLAQRTSSDFVAVGREGSIYLNNGKNPLSSWHRVKM
jgi:hypothetical protein